MPDRSITPVAIVGNLNVDQIIETVSRWPDWDEELLVTSSRLDLAGTAGYLALASQGLGIPPFVVSTVGDDANGDFIRRSMDELGMDTSGVVTLPGMQTSLGLIFVGEDGRRAILTVLGAHERMDVEIARSAGTQVAACREIFLCGTYLLHRFGARDVLPYAREMRVAGKLVVFDPSWDPAGWPLASRSEVLDLLAQVDLFLPNEPELCHLTGTDSWRDGVAAIGDRCAHVVVKRGAEGAVVIRDGVVTEHSGFPVQAVNTIGAGDVFDMGYLYGLRQDWTDAATVEFACGLAAMVVSQQGIRTYPTAEQVLAFIADQETTA